VTPSGTSDGPEEAGRLFKDLYVHPSLRSLPEGIPTWVHLALTQPLGLLNESLVAFTGGAFQGASLLCRSALEAACYVFLTRRKMANTEVAFWLDPPLGLDGKPRKIEFEELKAGVLSKKILTPDQVKALSRIQVHGNVIAHLVSRSDINLVKPIEKRRKLTEWLAPGDALEDIRDTMDIIKRLADSMFQSVPEGERKGPGRGGPA